MALADDFADFRSDSSHPIGLLSLNGKVTGRVNYSGDDDWFAINLAAGQTYLVTISAPASELIYKSVVLRSGSGVNGILASDLIRIPDASAGFTFTPTTTGTYYIESQGGMSYHHDFMLGSYEISVVAIGLNRAPSIAFNAASFYAEGTILTGSQLFSVSDLDGSENINYITIFDDPGNGGIWRYKGIEISPDKLTEFSVAYQNLDFLTYTTGPSSNTFEVRAYDKTGASSARVSHTITNNVAPVANDDYYVTPGGASLNVSSIEGILKNDADANGDPLVASSYWAPSNGTLVLYQSGAFTYTPNAGFVGVDTFTYLVNDGKTNSILPATVSITVGTVNVAPVANNDAYTMVSGATLTVSPGDGLLKNDMDANGDIITAVRYWFPANGLATVYQNGSFTYTPNPGFIGTDTFSYQITDGKTDSISPATVSITVTPAPLAGSISIGDLSIAELANGTRIANVAVSRTGGSASFSVNYSTAGGTATSGVDFGAMAGTLSFAEGVNVATIQVPIGVHPVSPDR